MCKKGNLINYSLHLIKLGANKWEKIIKNEGFLQFQHIF